VFVKFRYFNKDIRVHGSQIVHYALKFHQYSYPHAKFIFKWQGSDLHFLIDILKVMISQQLRNSTRTTSRTKIIITHQTYIHIVTRNLLYEHSPWIDELHLEKMQLLPHTHQASIYTLIIVQDITKPVLVQFTYFNKDIRVWWTQNSSFYIESPSVF
jgi:hypothetical protein